ncbi:MAG: sel1 repeat family protein, partial [Alphaproteobacteria bacterium]|nr:sel1 repeat family protein [Alphaproteobacteria bacterium]
MQGYSAYKGRQYEIAVPALKYAAAQGVLRGKFYLAKIYSDDNSRWVNHGAAYKLMSEIVDQYATV